MNLDTYVMYQYTQKWKRSHRRENGNKWHLVRDRKKINLRTLSWVVTWNNRKIMGNRNNKKIVSGSSLCSITCQPLQAGLFHSLKWHKYYYPTGFLWREDMTETASIQDMAVVDVNRHCFFSPSWTCWQVLALLCLLILLVLRSGSRSEGTLSSSRSGSCRWLRNLRGLELAWEFLESFSNRLFW